MVAVSERYMLTKPEIDLLNLELHEQNVTEMGSVIAYLIAVSSRKAFQTPHELSLPGRRIGDRG